MAIVIPHSFTNGYIAEASEVNANFGEVATFINNLENGSGLSSGAITTAKLADSAVTSGKLAPDSVITAKILDGNITTAKILDSNVTTAKIADSNVTAGKLATDSVTTAKIANSAVTLAKLATDAVPGVALISSTTIGSAVSSVTVSSAFSSTYDNYKIIISGGTTSTNLSLLLTFGSTTTGYYNVAYYVLSPAGNEIVNNNGSAISYAASGGTNGLNGCIEVISPNLAKNTQVMASHWFYDQGGGGFTSGYVADTTQYTAFTLTTSTGTMTGGTVKVYGYKN